MMEQITTKFMFENTDQVLATLYYVLSDSYLNFLCGTLLLLFSVYCNSFLLSYTQSALLIVYFYSITFLGLLYNKTIFTKRVDLKRKIAFITGASNGLGLHLSQLLMDRGMIIVNFDLVETIEPPLNDKKESCYYFYRLDLNNLKDIGTTIERAIKEVGEPYLLINNAGYFKGGSISKIKDEDIIKTININLTAYMLTAKYCFESLSKNRGQIVTISSVLGMVGVRKAVAYCASKSGTIGLFDSLDDEIQALQKNKRIKNTLVCPGHMKTKLFEKMEFKRPFLSSSFEPAVYANEIVNNIEQNKETEIYITVVIKLARLFRALPRWTRRIANSVVSTEYSTSYIE